MRNREKEPNDLDWLEAATSQLNASYVFRLFVTGCTPHSAGAIVNVRRFCEEQLRGRYTLEIIDLIQNPARAVQHQIVATPTLIRDAPLPQRRFVGNMSRLQQVLIAPALLGDDQKRGVPTQSGSGER